MKLTHIMGIILLIVGLVIVIFTLNDASTYADFAKAEMLSKADPDSEVHIVGELTKDADGNIEGMYYNPTENPNLFQFSMVDEKGREEQVIYFAPKPADIDKSEKVVIVAKHAKNRFIAQKILLKCPSKYTEENPQI